VGRLGVAADRVDVIPPNAVLVVNAPKSTRARPEISRTSGTPWSPFTIAVAIICAAAAAPTPRASTPMRLASARAR
jgi:hypothetical protein